MAGKKIRSSEITPEHVYMSRRQFLKTSLAFGAGALAAAACGKLEDSGASPALETPITAQHSSTPTGAVRMSTATPAPVKPEASPTATSAPPSPTEEPDPTGTPFAQAETDELGDRLTSYEAITNYNNYYEFTTWKEGVAGLARRFRTSPWDVEVSGLVHKPRTYGVEDLLKRFPQEERIYRLRCVEAWSMVIPWMGFSLASLLKEADPTSSARFVRFESIFDPAQMQGQRDPFYPWPYSEGLRLDEAMNDLTLMATGLYGQPLPPQNGAPLRLVVPWKYGFKSIKAIVKIELLEEMPATLWNQAAPSEYGFYANVNPQVSHPRWSQSSERRIGENGRRHTLLFNGYAEQVEGLYAGMDLQENY